MVEQVIYEVYCGEDKTGVIIEAENEDEAYDKISKMGLKNKNLYLVEL